MIAASRFRLAGTGALLALALASCARHAPPAAVAEAPAPIPARPQLNAAYAGVAVPAIGADGHYQTINAGIDPLQTVWHVRAALNVAAIGCRGAEGPGIVAAYNGLLKTKKALLAKANKSVEAHFRAQGAGWQDAHDQYMTRLYNFFSMPQATVNFCAVAATVAPRAAETDAAGFPAFAEAALIELQAPMIAVYQVIDDAHVRMAAWDARYGPNAVPGGTVTVETAAAATGAPATPQLGYTTETLLAWEPTPGQTMALR